MDKDNELELAWAAGFFDGEGSTSVEKNSASLKTTISQNDPEVLERFLKAVDVGSRIYGPYYYGPKKNPRWAVQICGKSAIIAVAKLWPYLGSIKRNQALRNLDRVTEILNGSKYPFLGNKKG